MLLWRLIRRGFHRSKHPEFAGPLGEPNGNWHSCRCDATQPWRHLEKAGPPGTRKSNEQSLCRSCQPPETLSPYVIEHEVLQPRARVELAQQASKINYLQKSDREGWAAGTRIATGIFSQMISFRHSKYSPRTPDTAKAKRAS